MILLRNFFLLALSCLYLRTAAQQFPLPQATISSDSALQVSMPLLANKILPRLKPDEDTWTYLSQLLMVQLTAKKYAAALQTIQQYRQAFAQNDPEIAGIKFIQYETYARAMLSKAPFEPAFRRAFMVSLKRLNEGNRFDIDNWYSPDTAFLTADFRRQLQQQQGKDSISLQDALSLCRRYIAWQLLPPMATLAKPLLAAENKDRYLINDSVLVKTRDGAMVSAIVVRPKGQQHPLPVIFFFTIYTEVKNLCIAKEAADKGFVGVVANTRGKRLSTDTPVPYEYDGNDAWDALDWISHQSWCNGKIGMYGGSYVGFTQWAAVKHGVHPALKTIVPSAAVVPGFDVPKENNVYLSFVYPWIPYVTNNKFLDNVTYYDQQRWRGMQFRWYNSGAAYQTLDSTDGQPNPVFQRWLAHPAYDQYWQNMTAYREDFSRIHIPVLSTTGYFDGAQIGAMYYLREHYRNNPTADHYLVIGPFDHLGCQHVPAPYLNGYKTDAVAHLSIHQLIYQWFDYILKDGKKPALLQDKINYQVMGTNQWKHVPSLEKMNNDTLTFYLDQQRLSLQQPVSTGFVTRQVDLSDREGGFTSNYILSRLIASDINTSNSSVFVSEPFTQSVNINGSFLGKLQAVVNKKDVDIGIDLYEQLPDGRYFQLSYYLGRASYAADPEKRQLLVPGAVSTISFSNTRMISQKISKGSRLVVVININKNPFEEINYGSGKKVSEETIADAGEPVRIQWRNDSYIRIPVWRD